MCFRSGLLTINRRNIEMFKEQGVFILCVIYYQTCKGHSRTPHPAKYENEKFGQKMHKFTAIIINTSFSHFWKHTNPIKLYNYL